MRRANISPIWQPTVKTGFSADSASWKIIAISLPRTCRRSSSGSLSRSPPLEEDLAAGDEAGRHVQDAHDRLGGDGLAGAGLAEHGEGLAGVQVVADTPLTTLATPVAGAELDVQVPDLEQVARPAGRRRVG